MGLLFSGDTGPPGVNIKPDSSCCDTFGKLDVSMLIHVHLSTVKFGYFVILYLSSYNDDK